jgi:hypothetical protein
VSDDGGHEIPTSPTEGERWLARRLGSEGLHKIDVALERHASPRFQKVAMVVMLAWKESGVAVMTESHLGLYVRRVIELVEARVLEGAGNLRNPTRSEVRLARRSV